MAKGDGMQDDNVRPPGPPAVPRCSECDRVVSHQGHAPECRRGQQQAEEWATARKIEEAVGAYVRERRKDKPFMDRLLARIEADKAVLDKLADL